MDASPRTYSTQAVVDATGLSYRQIDGWSRGGALEPAEGASGSGSRRRFTLAQIRAIRLGKVLSDHGAQLSVIHDVVAGATRWPDPLWTGRVLVTRSGDMYPIEGAPVGAVGWVLDLDRAREHVGEQLFVNA